MLSGAFNSILQPIKLSSAIPANQQLHRQTLNLGFGATVEYSDRMSTHRRFMTCFKNPVTNDGNSLESKTGHRAGEEEELCHEAAEQGNFAEHLVVMVNGLGGSSKDWNFAAKKFVERIPDKVIVHRSECNTSRLTYDGVDLMGERLAEEVISVVKQKRGVHKISFVAHSLGGLIARYAIGRLYKPIITNGSFHVAEDHKDDDRGLKGQIAGLEPINFITFGSPHLGSRGHKQLPILCGLSFLERKVSELAHLVIGRTGKHLFLTDDDDGKPPLLLRMVDDNDDIKFRSALCSFKRRVAYANANSDHMVGWRTSSIRCHYELPEQRHLVYDENYPHIVHVDKGEKITYSNTSTVVSTSTIEEKMIEGLTKVTWERVDVSFQKSILRYDAHNNIQVRIYWLNSVGVDVIYHMIDNFLL